MPETILNIVAKYIQVEHITNEMYPAAMDKHRSDERQENRCREVTIKQT